MIYLITCVILWVYASNKSKKEFEKQKRIVLNQLINKII